MTTQQVTCVNNTTSECRIQKEMVTNRIIYDASMQSMRFTFFKQRNIKWEVQMFLCFSLQRNDRNSQSRREKYKIGNITSHTHLSHFFIGHSDADNIWPQKLRPQLITQMLNVIVGTLTSQIKVVLLLVFLRFCMSLRSLISGTFFSFFPLLQVPSFI